MFSSANFYARQRTKIDDGLLVSWECDSVDGNYIYSDKFESD